MRMDTSLVSDVEIRTSDIRTRCDRVLDAEVDSFGGHRLLTLTNRLVFAITDKIFLTINSSHHLL